MVVPAEFKFNNTITNMNVAIDDAIASAFANTISTEVLLAFFNLVANGFKVYTPEGFGAVSGTVSTGQRTLNYTALTDMFTAAIADPSSIVWLGNEVWEVDDILQPDYLDQDIFIYGGGQGTIRFVPVSSNNSRAMIIYTTGGGNVVLNGWGVDASSLSPVALEFINYDDTYKPGQSWKFENLFGVNTKVVSNAGNAGYGIWIHGFVERLFANKLYVDEIVLGDGFGVPGSLGVVGIYIGNITISGTDCYPIYKEITNIFIGEVYAEDDTYLDDQDGIDVFDPPGSATDRLKGTTYIRGITHLNPQGRSIKIQAQNVSIFQVDGYFLDGSENPHQRAGALSKCLIDFQNGEGNATDITAYCHNCAPFRLVIGTARTYASGTITVTRGKFIGVGASIPLVEGFLFRYGDANHLRGRAILSECSSYGVELTCLASIMSRPASGEETFAVKHNSTEEIDAAGVGVIMEGDTSAANLIFYGNINDDAAVNIYSATSITVTLVMGVAADNINFT